MAFSFLLDGSGLQPRIGLPGQSSSSNIHVGNRPDRSPPAFHWLSNATDMVRCLGRMRNRVTCLGYARAHGLHARRSLLAPAYIIFRLSPVAPHCFPTLSIWIITLSIHQSPSPSGCFMLCDPIFHLALVDTMAVAFPLETQLSFDPTYRGIVHGDL